MEDFSEVEKGMDVFISNKLNSRKQRFGFVGFQGVADVYFLERSLDVIWIGTWKLQVNLPKMKGKERMGSKMMEEQTRKMWRSREQEQLKQQKLSFDQVVSGKKPSSSHGVGVASHFSVKVESSSWLDRCFVGFLAEAPNIQLIKEFYYGWF